MEGVQGVGAGAASGGATSPTTSIRPGTAGSYKRKRSGIEFESSPGSGGEDNEEEAERRRQPGVKRACNECRQQKVSHYIILREKEKERRKERKKEPHATRQ